jgi:uncharacterized protein YggU (UPF0235/DUF167 family)
MRSRSIFRHRGAGRSSTHSAEGTIWKVYVHEAPTDGKANEAVRKLIAKHLKVAQSAVQIVSGKSSKLKWVEIQS